MFIENREHVGPEGFLPLEDSLFGHNVGCDVGLQASLEEQMGQGFNIVVGVVVDHDGVLVIGQITLVDHKWSASILGQVGGQKSSLSNLRISGTVFSTDSMTLEKYRSLVT